MILEQALKELQVETRFLWGTPFQADLGLTPAKLYFGYLVDHSRVDFVNHRGPSTIMAYQLCTGVAVTRSAENSAQSRQNPDGPSWAAFRCLSR